MAVIIRQTMPADASLEMMDQVGEEMGVKDNPPEGLIVHTHYEEAAKLHILDVWDSAEAHEKFAKERLGPAVQAVAARRGLDAGQSGPPEFTVTKVHSVVRGS